MIDFEGKNELENKTIKKGKATTNKLLYLQEWLSIGKARVSCERNPNSKLLKIWCFSFIHLYPTINDPLQLYISQIVIYSILYLTEILPHGQNNSIYVACLTCLPFSNVN